MLGVFVVWSGFVIAFVGAFNVLRPWHWLHIENRGAALLVCVGGWLLSLLGTLLPAPERRVEETRTRLDEFAPAYQFNEIHSLEISASCAKAYDATQSVTAEDICFFRTLVWIRRFGRSGPESILNPTRNAPILDVATRSSFLKLSEEANRELVVGTIVARPQDFPIPANPTPEWVKSLKQPGIAWAVMNFRFEDRGPDKCIVSTETRVYATSSDTRRKFAAYWRVIYPGSALIRRMWLRTIAKRAAA